MKKLTRLLIALLLVTVMIAPAAPFAYADEAAPSGVSITAENFPDPLFRKFLLEGSHSVWDENNVETVIVYDANKDGFLSTEEAANIKQLLIGQTLIRDLTGIENLPALIEIDCQYSAVKNMDLSQNTELQILNCYKTQLTGTLDLSNNTKLEGVACHRNRGLTGLDVSGCANLVTVTCENTSISSLDFSNNPLLRNVSCGDTQVYQLDFSNNPELAGLSAYSTNLSSLDVSSNTKLTYLDVTTNALAWLNIGNNDNLDCMISDSKLKIDLPEGSFDISEMYPGIDPSKITIVSGASIDGSVISGYEVDAPIVYTYDCGSDMYGPVLLNVTINPQAEEADDVLDENDEATDDVVTTDPVEPDDKSDNTVQTGDDFPMPLLIVIMLAAVGVMFGVFRRKA